MPARAAISKPARRRDRFGIASDVGAMVGADTPNAGWIYLPPPLRLRPNWSTNAPQLPNRPDGCLASAAANTGSSPANPGRNAAIDGGCALRCWPITIAALEPPYGGVPANEGNEVQPNTHI